MQAIFAHQGPALERELADLRSAVEDAEGALETVKPALKDAGLVGPSTSLGYSLSNVTARAFLHTVYDRHLRFATEHKMLAPLQRTTFL